MFVTSCSLKVPVQNLIFALNFSVLCEFSYSQQLPISEMNLFYDVLFLVHRGHIYYHIKSKIIKNLLSY